MEHKIKKLIKKLELENSKRLAVNGLNDTAKRLRNHKYNCVVEFIQQLKNCL